MFAECLTPGVQHVMCCYFGMWTRHWPLLNDDSSKKEGKNVMQVVYLCVHRASAPWCTCQAGRVQEHLWCHSTNIWESSQHKRKDFQPRHGCEKYISGIYHDHESGMPTFSLEFPCLLQQATMEQVTRVSTLFRTKFHTP